MECNLFNLMSGILPNSIVVLKQVFFFSHVDIMMFPRHFHTIS